MQPQMSALTVPVGDEEGASVGVAEGPEVGV